MSIKIIELKWERTLFRKIKYNGKPRTIETWKAHTNLFDSYMVEQTVSGRFYVKTPSYRNLDNLGSVLTEYRRECKSTEDGKNICRLDWESKINEAFITTKKRLGIVK